MAKPLTIARQEFVNALTELVENVELPAFAIANELELMLARLKPIIEAQYSQDLQNSESQSEEGADTDDNPQETGNGKADG